METIKINIKKDSKAAIAIGKHMEEKKAFIKAVAAGKAIEYVKKRPEKFASPV